MFEKLLKIVLIKKYVDKPWIKFITNFLLFEFIFSINYILLYILIFMNKFSKVNETISNKLFNSVNNNNNNKNTFDYKLKVILISFFHFKFD